MNKPTKSQRKVLEELATNSCARLANNFCGWKMNACPGFGVHKATGESLVRHGMVFLLANDTQGISEYVISDKGKKALNEQS